MRISISAWAALVLIACTPEPGAEVGDATSTSTGEPSTSGDGDGDSTGDGDGDGDGDSTGDGDGDGDTTGDGDGDATGDVEGTVVLFPAEDPDTQEHALYFMRLDVLDPLATLDLLLEGRWVPERYSDSDGRFVVLDNLDEPLEPAYVDFGVDPPAIHAFELPPELTPLKAALLDDSSALLVIAFDEPGDRQLLYRVPLEDDGSPGAPELLTPQAQARDRYVFPLMSDISADVSTLAVVSLRLDDPQPYRMVTVDLVDPADSPTFVGTLNQSHGSVSPAWVHVTPEGGEIAVTQSDQLGSDAYWLDADGVPGQQLIGAGSIETWAGDGRSGLLINQLPGFKETSWVELDDQGLTLTPVDVDPVFVTMIDPNGRLMLFDDAQGGSVRVGPKLGPWPYVLGGAADEAPVIAARHSPGDMFLVNYQGQGVDVAVVEVVGEVVTDSVVIAENSPGIAYWAAFSTHAAVSFAEDPKIWTLDYSDPLASLEVLLPELPAPDPGMRVFAPDGRHVLELGAGDYYLASVDEPGVASLVDMGGDRPSEIAYVAPFERDDY